MLGKIILGKLSRVFCLSGIIVLLLSACTSHQISTGIAPPTSVHIEISPSVTVTSIPTITARPTQTIAATPTVDAITALASEFNVPPVCLFTNSYIISNNRTWLGADCKINRELVITNKISDQKIVVEYQKIDAEGYDNFFTVPLSWSSDNRYLYFTTRCCSYYDESSSNGSLYQYDVDKKEFSILIHGSYKPFYFFSQDGDKLIYLNHYPTDPPYPPNGDPQYLEIGMLEKQVNKSKRVVLKDYWGPLNEQPNYMWSKNSDQFAIVINQLTKISISGIEGWVDSEKVLLKIDFKHWNMELIKEFNPEKLIEE